MIAEEEDSLLHNVYVLQPSPKFKRERERVIKAVNENDGQKKRVFRTYPS